MKKQRLLTIAIGLLLVAGAVWVIRWPRTISSDRCSALYRQFAGNPDIDASFIKDFRINDSTAVDVTLLEALSDSGWDSLCKFFLIPDLDTISPLVLKTSVPLLWQVNKYDYASTVVADSPDVEILAVSYRKRQACIFHTCTHDERHNVFYYNFDKYDNQNKHQ